MPHIQHVLLGFLITFIAFMLGRYTSKFLPKIPVLVSGMVWVILLLWLCQWPYQSYMHTVNPYFNNLLGYVTVALAIPLAAMRIDDLPLKAVASILVLASISSVILPMSLAYLFHLGEPTVLAFATRAVTTPVAINIASLLGSPIPMVILIVIISGLIGAAFSPFILRNINDERASGFALGLAAHAIGTVQAWQRGAVAGRYAAFGMALNAVFTSIWLPCVFYLFK